MYRPKNQKQTEIKHDRDRLQVPHARERGCARPASERRQTWQARPRTVVIIAGFCAVCGVHRNACRRSASAAAPKPRWRRRICESSPTYNGLNGGKGESEQQRAARGRRRVAAFARRVAAGSRATDRFGRLLAEAGWIVGAVAAVALFAMLATLQQRRSGVLAHRRRGRRAQHRRPLRRVGGRYRAAAVRPVGVSAGIRLWRSR